MLISPLSCILVGRFGVIVNVQSRHSILFLLASPLTTSVAPFINLPHSVSSCIPKKNFTTLVWLEAVLCFGVVIVLVQ
jgi:hypothetical protein